MEDERFLDTNVLVYLYSRAEPDKQTLAQTLVNQHQTVISTQARVGWSEQERTPTFR